MRVYCKALIEGKEELDKLPPEIPAAVRDFVRFLLEIDLPEAGLRHLAVINCNGTLSIRVLSGRGAINPTTAEYSVDLAVDPDQIQASAEFKALVVAQLLVHWQAIDQGLITARTKFGEIIAALAASTEEVSCIYLIVAKGGKDAAEQQAALLRLAFPTLSFKVKTNGSATTFIAASGGESDLKRLKSFVGDLTLHK